MVFLNITFDPIEQFSPTLTLSSMIVLLPIDVSHESFNYGLY